MKSKTLDERPELFPDIQWIWEAFQVLGRSRPYGYGGPLPIPTSEVLAYCQLRGIHTWDDREDLIYFVNVLDNEWISDQYKKQAAEREKTKTKASTPRKPR